MYYYGVHDYILRSKVKLCLFFIKIELIFFNPKTMTILLFRNNNKGWTRRINVWDYVL